MNKEFVSYTQALALKELGFDEPCFGGYVKLTETQNTFFMNDVISEIDRETPLHKDLITKAPLYQQAFRWFREKHNLRGFIGFRPNVKKFDYHVYDMSLSGEEYVKQRTMEEFNKDPKVGTYEEAESACLDKLIEIVKNK